MPFDMSRDAWHAYNAGAEAWKTYLEEVEGQLTLKSFENLKRVVPLERKALASSEEPLLRLVPDDSDRPSFCLNLRKLSFDFA